MTSLKRAVLLFCSNLTHDIYYFSHGRGVLRHLSRGGGLTFLREGEGGISTHLGPKTLEIIDFTDPEGTDPPSPPPFIPLKTIYIKAIYIKITRVEYK